MGPILTLGQILLGWESAMMENGNCLDGCTRQSAAANDNGETAALDATLLDEPVFRLARLLARQIAREHFATMKAANDNNAESEPEHRI
jgi:hypothetical protein